jgi:uncharacterized membrane protein
MTPNSNVLLTGSTVVTMIVGLAIPALLALVTRASIPARAKVLVTLALTAISGVVASVVTWPSSGSGWLHLLLNVILTFVAAAAADPTLFRRSATASYIADIHNATDRHFGVGKYDPTLELHT